MTEEQRKIILHALGFSRPRRWSYRNVYYVPNSTQPDQETQSLVDAGFMKHSFYVYYHDGGGEYFNVTESGARAAGVWNKVRKEDRR